jgi:hypothetical protein
VIALAVAFVVAAAVAGAALAAQPGGFPQSPPNDPSYATGPGCTSSDAGEFWLFSTIPLQCLPATDPEGAAGMSVDSGWRDYTTGDPGTVIAYIEGGINYRDATAKDLVNQVYLNEGELPYPELANGSSCGRYDCNGDGVFNVEDYAQDSRIAKPYVEGYLTPEDLLKAFGDCKVDSGTHLIEFCKSGHHYDNDHNGYPNDISGWDFMHDTNDVQTDWSGYWHSDDMTVLMAAQTNNGIGDAGECPRCRIMFVKAGDEAIARSDRQAEAVLYAVDARASVIAEEAVGLGVSQFQLQANQYAWDHNVPMSVDANDFDSTDHTDGMLYPHVLPGNSLVRQYAAGVAVPLSFRDHSSITSWGTHAMFSVPTTEGSTSEATPMQAGALALLMSYGRQRASNPQGAAGTPGAPLSAGEATQLMIASSSAVEDPSLQWPGKLGYDWSLNYGYGRPNIHKALSLIAAGRIPPVPDITSPRWYQRYDPARDPGGSIVIDGKISARRAQSATVQVQYALGPEPGPSDWHTLPSLAGMVHGSYSGPLARLKLSDIPASFYERPFRNTGDRTPTTTDLAPEQYAVTIRVNVTDDRGLLGVDRRAVYVNHDPSQLPGFPRSQGFAGGESPPVLADLQGTGRTDIILANDNGMINAYAPDGRELPGWPAHTAIDPYPARYRTAPAYRTVRLPREPIGTPVAVGDLLGNGRLDVVAASENGRLYAWDQSGRPLPGFPRQVSDAPPYPVPSPAITGHSPTNASFIGPVLAHLQNNRQLDIVLPTWDGYVHALRPNGRELPGWPVRLKLPTAMVQAANQHGETYFNDEAIVSSPAIADVAAIGHPQVILGSEESLYPEQALLNSVGEGPDEVLGYRPVYAIYADGNLHPGGPFLNGWPVLISDELSNVAGGIDFVFNATESPAVGDFLGNGGLQVAVGTAFGPTQILTASGSVATTLSPLGRSPEGPDSVYDFTGSGAAAKVGNQLDYFAPGSGERSVLEDNQLHHPIYNFTQGWDPRSGQPLSGFPQIQQGLSFFGAPSIASVETADEPDVLEPTDSMTLHAFRADGQGEAPGFPKFTGGWSTFAPAVGDLTGDGHADIVLVTREGYLEAFRTPGQMQNAQWCGFQGGPQRTGLYTGHCTTPVGAPRPGCPAPTGRLSGRILGRIALDETRARIRAGLRRNDDHRAPYTDVFCFTPIGIRVGYPPPAVTSRLHPAVRSATVRRAVLILTANRYYALARVRAGTTIASARRTLRLERPIRTGVNTWYLTPMRHVTGVLKVRHGIVEEVGIADARFTTPRALAIRFLSSF